MLKSGVVEVNGVDRILEHPEKYIESSEYFSWERYFTGVLESATSEDEYKRYSKNNLSRYYMTDKCSDKILDALPDIIKSRLI